MTDFNYLHSVTIWNFSLVKDIILRLTLPKNTCFVILIFLSDCMILPAILLFSSCDQPSRPSLHNVAVKKAMDINKIKKEHYSAPKVISITASSKPKRIGAGKPMMKIDSSNGGQPFFTNYSTDQGLALSAVGCEIQDRDGNLWFGTQGGGLSKYDGKSFTTYTSANGLANNSVQCIMQDRAGDYWFATQGGGVSRYDGKRFKNYGKREGLAANIVWDIIQDRSGNIWFGTYGGGVCEYSGKTLPNGDPVFRTYTTANGLAGNDVHSIMQDRLGNMWFGTDGNGISRYDGKAFTNYDTSSGLPGNSVWSIILDSSGDIWFAVYGAGVSRFDGKTFTNYTAAKGTLDNNVWTVMQDKSGIIWLGTFGAGLKRYESKIFTTISTKQGLAANSVLGITQDRTGAIWFSTSGGGVSRYDGKSSAIYSPSQGLPDDQVFPVIQDRSGKFWFGTQGGGFSRFDGKIFENYSASQGLVNDRVSCIMQEKSGDIWLGTYGGASKFNGKTFENYTTIQGLPANDVHSMLQDRHGDIWFGTNGGGVSRFNGKNFTNFDTAQGLASNDVWTMIEDRSGNIWIGTNGGGVSKYNGEIFTNYTTEQGLVNNEVVSMMQDHSGDIWIGTEEGVSRYDGQHFKNYTTADGLADNSTYSMVEDSIRHIIWFGTNKGLSGLMSRHSTGGNAQGDTIVIFNKETGYPIKDLNTNSLLVDNNGKLWAACGDVKLVRFDYDAINKNTEPLALRIQHIKVNNEDLCWNSLAAISGIAKSDSMTILNEMVSTFGKVLPPAVLKSLQKKYADIEFDSVMQLYPVPGNLVLPYKDNNLTIDFVAIEPDRPKQVKYQYILEGYNNDWSQPENRTTAVFGNIPEGKYIFKLRALSPYGVWSETQYTFRVRPPWYRAIWAYALYGISLLTVAIILDRFRRKILIEKERAKTRERELAQSREIEKAYTQLEAAHENLKTTQAQLIQSEKMASLGELTAGIAHEIQNPLNFVNNFSEVNKELTEELEEEIDKGNPEELKALALEIRSNEEKIRHHGQRASAIVKGMLEHSRNNTGQKVLTDINVLTDAYLKLAQHGMRSKDNTFNATINIDFDTNTGLISVVPQDIGRVLVNLYSNAFYAVMEKKKSHPVGYEPIVSVTAKKINNNIEIRVKDNGIGIPVKIIDKIFQPFFTTKPTGQGTGLGLSLSYDIVKAHAGEITVKSQEGEYTEFLVCLPISP